MVNEPKIEIEKIPGEATIQYLNMSLSPTKSVWMNKITFHGTRRHKVSYAGSRYGKPRFCKICGNKLLESAYFCVICSGRFSYVESIGQSYPMPKAKNVI